MKTHATKFPTHAQTVLSSPVSTRVGSVSLPMASSAAPPQSPWRGILAALHALHPRAGTLLLVLLGSTQLESEAGGRRPRRQGVGGRRRRPAAGGRASSGRRRWLRARTYRLGSRRPVRLFLCGAGGCYLEFFP